MISLTKRNLTPVGETQNILSADARHDKSGAVYYFERRRLEYREHLTADERLTADENLNTSHTHCNCQQQVELQLGGDGEVSADAADERAQHAGVQQRERRLRHASHLCRHQ